MRPWSHVCPCSGWVSNGINLRLTCATAIFLMMYSANGITDLYVTVRGLPGAGTKGTSASSGQYTSHFFCNSHPAGCINFSVLIRTLTLPSNVRVNMTMVETRCSQIIRQKSSREFSVGPEKPPCNNLVQPDWKHQGLTL